MLNPLAATPLLSPPTKPTISLASARLTRSEIDSLRQGKKRIAAYAQKAFKDRVAAAKAENAKDRMLNFEC
jgi:hypothetical protein